MSASDGAVVGTTQILNNGPAARRFNIVILSEGYQQAQLGQFANDAAAFVTRLSRTPPFHLVMNSINVFRVDVSSTDTGADDPVTCGGGGGTARTYFDATFCGDGTNQRLLTVNNTLALQVANAEVPQHRLVVVIVNSPIYGGSGGPVAVYSLAANAVDIALHEIGHTAFALADEYETFRGCASGELDHNNHPAVEPAAENVTVTGFNNIQRLKWRRYVRAGTALPTTRNANCAVCDPQPSPVPSGAVGAFEGADTYHCSAYRPEFDCKMRTLASDFCRVCSDVILHRLWQFSPLSVRFAWKGVGGDQTLYNGRASESYQYHLPDFKSSTGPALISDNQGAFMAWKGISNDQGIYYSVLRHIDGVTWDTQHNVPGVGTSTGPAAAMFQGRAYLAWKGAFNDQGINFTRFEGGLPAAQRNVPGVGTSTRPALAVYRGRLYMAWKGIANDQSMWFASFDGNQWSAQAPIPNVGTSAYPALAVIGDRLYMVWKGIEGDQSVWFTSFDGSRWAPQAPVPNVGTATGVSLSAGPDRLFMAWSGVAGDPSLYYTTFDGRTWGRQHNYLGTGSSAVPAVHVRYYG
ncbi:IgA Peptidase M64 [Pelotomaculum schinkii]|uniref:IgA Peptidase M64 n=1 Tax=Pelotomaculum schinkii TaxID=78350 RepID=A0A4Y7R9Y2_9FIRM|nr:M64 family metallopeptidase [Pelotomaculum schinkii]TEB05461.1 IgA Peptidase M64 [Pelotomaculum schinkii]